MVELIGDNVPTQYESLFKESPYLRLSMANKNNVRWAKTQPDQYLTALTISRGTNRMDDIRKFYSSSIGVSEVFSKVYDDGTELVIMSYDSNGPNSE